MLRSYINAVPCTKFILLADSLESRDVKLFDCIVKGHLAQKHKIHLCVFEGVFKKAQDKFQSSSNITLHNFVSGDNELRDHEAFEELCSGFLNNEVVIIDSLANAILQYGLSLCYKVFNFLRNNKALKQIITVLHKDLLSSDLSQATLYFNNLVTLNIDIQPKFMTDSLRLCYQYKKSGGRIISEIEEYRFEGESLITTKVAKPDADKLLTKIAPNSVNPEDLTTFKIRLTDEEKLSRDRVVLPYLPSANKEDPSTEGHIFYQFDEVDDWDEEDPDDDLDI
ncbi:elongator complex protein 5 [Euwallacea fornicatus]|uniref:elongator complex protein 5 n=1 Tax=Euwallacea fornicatus TaxID=995702 RepID=UPI0033903A70